MVSFNYLNIFKTVDLQSSSNSDVWTSSGKVSLLFFCLRMGHTVSLHAS